MFLKMKKTTPVSTTGLNNLEWIKGKIYDAPADLARNLVTGGLATLKKGESLPDLDAEIDESFEEVVVAEKAEEVEEDLEPEEVDQPEDDAHEELEESEKTGIIEIDE